MIERHTQPADAAEVHVVGDDGWSDFLVSAPIRLPVPRDGLRSSPPAGEAHARQVGASQTLCGRSAVNWPYFWSLAFDPAQPSACPACVTVAVELSLATTTTGRGQG
jgi:hypothetical protein